ncbi:MAG: DUF2490 domain-containing protein [Cyclobacteriaceae bacterium]|nr:DUF2490 domain-containing protein [Cyclobacteriaceae bacterium]UYN86428.1 MAG: DUF2490 domain-containing protein [Cyclobacteriaceae bacterium]
MKRVYCDKRFLKTYFFIIGLVAVFPAHSQQEREKLDNRIVYTKYTIYDFFKEGSKWGWDLDVVYRRQSTLGEKGLVNSLQEPLRFSIRPWLAYQPTKYTRISFNPIGLFNSAPRYPLESDLDRPFERELRTTLQINHSTYFKRFNFTHRLRFESRWRGIDNEDGSVHNWRIRYRIRTRIPLNTNYFYTNRTVYVSQYSEMHVEFGKNYGFNNFSQNRNYLGVGVRFWDWARVEAGYIYQLNVRSNLYQVDVSRGPMFYLFIDYLSKLRLSN